VIGVGRKTFSQEEFREYVAIETKTFIKQDEVFSQFLSKIHYACVELTKYESYVNLQEKIDSFWTENTQIVFYLAISPEFFLDFIQ